MRFPLKAAAAVMAAAMLAVGVAAPAEAAKKPKKSWMTKKEFRRITVGSSDGSGGSTMAQVRKTAGSAGVLSYEYTSTTGGYCDEYDDEYENCLVYLPEVIQRHITLRWKTGKYFHASVGFIDGRVISKSFSQ